jgi:hypothetical protein
MVDVDATGHRPPATGHRPPTAGSWSWRPRGAWRASRVRRPRPVPGPVRPAAVCPRPGQSGEQGDPAEVVGVHHAFAGVLRGALGGEPQRRPRLGPRPGQPRNRHLRPDPDPSGGQLVLADPVPAHTQNAGTAAQWGDGADPVARSSRPRRRACSRPPGRRTRGAGVRTRVEHLVHAIAFASRHPVPHRGPAVAVLVGHTPRESHAHRSHGRGQARDRSPTVGADQRIGHRPRRNTEVPPCHRRALAGDEGRSPAPRPGAGSRPHDCAGTRPTRARGGGVK